MKHTPASRRQAAGAVMLSVVIILVVLIIRCSRTSSPAPDRQSLQITVTDTVSAAVAPPSRPAEPRKTKAKHSAPQPTYRSPLDEGANK